MRKKFLQYCVETGVGLQKVDNLDVSENFLNIGEKYINNEISYDEAYKLITDYYENKRDDSTINSDDKPDLVSLNISEELRSEGFVFTVGQLVSIHKKLFTNVYSHAGKLRNYNFIKKEGVLKGETVTYADYRELEETLEYDFVEERKYSYKDKTMDEIIEHLSTFIANLWQIHPFSEGNTRTTAVFVIKYLRTLGFDVTNDIFAKNAWFFRNSLVRANYNNISKGIFADKSFLILFLRNLLLGEKNFLENKLLSVEISKIELIELSKNEKLVLDLIKVNKNIKVNEIAEKINKSERTVKTILFKLQSKDLIRRKAGKRFGYWQMNEKKKGK